MFLVVAPLTSGGRRCGRKAGIIRATLRLLGQNPYSGQWALVHRQQIRGQLAVHCPE
jgi:hypothetical protein